MITRLPDELTNLLHNLMAASNSLSAYCTKHGETELSQFFQPGNPERSTPLCGRENCIRESKFYVPQRHAVNLN